MIEEAEYRFDQIKPEEEWAGLIWECCREGTRATAAKATRIWTLGWARDHAEFPETPWLKLPLAERESAVNRWHDHLKRPEDGALELSLIAECGGAASPEEWREKLAKLGCVVLDFGMKGRLTRAQMLTLFNGWLDANPDWASETKIIPVYGKRSPGEGLRRIAWERLMQAAKSNEKRQTKVSAYANELAWKDPAFKKWLGVPRTLAKRSQWRREARVWVTWVCSG